MLWGHGRRYPPRYSLLSGEFSFRNDQAEILPGNAPLILDPARPTIATLLRNQDYTTAPVEASDTCPPEWRVVYPALA